MEAWQKAWLQEKGRNFHKDSNVEYLNIDLQLRSIDDEDNGEQVGAFFSICFILLLFLLKTAYSHMKKIV